MLQLKNLTWRKRKQWRTHFQLNIVSHLTIMCWKFPCPALLPLKRIKMSSENIKHTVRVMSRYKSIVFRKYAPFALSPEPLIIMRHFNLFLLIMKLAASTRTSSRRSVFWMGHFRAESRSWKSWTGKGRFEMHTQFYFTQILSLDLLVDSWRISNCTKQSLLWILILYNSTVVTFVSFT